MCQVKPTDTFSSFPFLKDKICIHTCSPAPLSCFTHWAINLFSQPQLLSSVSKEKVLNFFLDSYSCPSLPVQDPAPLAN